MGLRLGSNLAMKELVEVSARVGKATPEVVASEAEVVVPVT